MRGEEPKLYNIHQIKISESGLTSRIILTIVISKLLDQMLRLETRHVTLTFFWDNFDLCPLEENSYKLVVLRPSWLILRITWGLKLMDCWLLPHPELVRILRGGTPEYELLKAPVWSWLSARFWNGCFRASQESLNTCWVLEPHWIGPHSGRGFPGSPGDKNLPLNAGGRRFDPWSGN